MSSVHQALNSWKEQGHCLVDLRSPEAYAVKHIATSTNIPSHELLDRMQELPERGEQVAILGSQETLNSVREHISNGYPVLAEFIDEPSLWDYVAERGWTETGDISRRLWKPCPFLAEFIDQIESNIPPGERCAIDIACGSGRDAMFLSGRGWRVVGVDNVELRLTKLQEMQARDHCQVEGMCLDLEPDLAPDLGSAEPDWQNVRSKLFAPSPVGYNIVHVARYLHRPLMPILRDLVKPGGYVVYHTFMVPSMGKPRRPRFLLNPNELAETFAGFEIIAFRESKFPDGRPAQYLCARKRT